MEVSAFVIAVLPVSIWIAGIARLFWIGRSGLAVIALVLPPVGFFIALYGILAKPRTQLR
ncbi:MAG: hypothetical protein GY722_25345 [bacterium]|nr:hypothetical protein [bacterium]